MYQELERDRKGTDKIGGQGDHEPVFDEHPHGTHTT